MGVTVFLAGIVYVYFSLLGIILIVFGAFVGFTSVKTFVDTEKKKVRFSNILFGIIPTGKWITITTDMKIGLKKSRRGFRTYSRGMRTNDVVLKDIRIVLYGSGNKMIGPIQKCKSLEDARKSAQELNRILELEIL